MNNFVFSHPTKVLFGKNTIPLLGQETMVYGKKVLLVYGQGSIVDNGIHEKVLKSLLDSGLTLTEYSGITPNPDLDEVKKGIHLFHSHSCEVICAVGGGSVIDAAKAISCGLQKDQNVWKFISAKKKIEKTIPVTCVSTVAGSGSENNHGMVITNPATRQKFGFGNRFLYPKISILDPETSYTVSPQQTAYGCVDTISHLVEIYCNNSLNRPTFQSAMMPDLINSVLKSCLAAIVTPDDYFHRAQLMWSASLPLSGFFSSGLGRIDFPVHLIEHSVSALYNSPHGAGLAVLLPGWMIYRAAKEPETVASLGRELFQVKGKTTASEAIETARRFKSAFTKLGCPTTLQELGVSESSFQEIAENAQPLAKLWRLRHYSPEVILTILHHCT